jgi:hypothetical protein
MSATNSVVAVYDSHEEAERAVKALQRAGVDMKSLSIAGGAYIPMNMWLATTTLAIG